MHCPGDGSAGLVVQALLILAEALVLRSFLDELQMGLGLRK